MIAFRHTDPRYPGLWESAEQPPGRWHGELEGPASYFADTPHGAWAEFLRHEAITDEADLRGVRRALWAVEIADEKIAAAARPLLPARTVTGGLDSYPACQAAARRLRRRQGATALVAPSAALLPGGAAGWRVDNELAEAPPRDGVVVVLYGRQPELVGWSAVHLGQPDPRLLPLVRQL